MVAAATTIYELQTTGDSAAGWGFNPANANMATDGVGAFATQSAPEFSSASYNFIGRDVGHWLFIKSGTNWRPGWYQITAVTLGVAQLNATTGQWVAYKSTDANRPGAGTGCATTASPTGATWSIDYSQDVPISFTDLVAVTTTTFTSAANSIGKNFVGNIVRVNSGTGWNQCRWEVSSVTGTTGTAANFQNGFGNLGTSGSTGGTGKLGGAAVSPGALAAILVAGNAVYQKSGTYTLSAATANTVGGPVSLALNASSGSPSRWIGYYAYRGDRARTTRALFQIPASGVTNVTVFAVTGAAAWINIENLHVDGASKIAIRGFDIGGYGAMTSYCKATQCTTGGFYSNTTSVSPKFLFCESNSNSGSFPAFACTGTGGALYAFCEANSNSVVAMELDALGSQAVFCSFANNTAGVAALRNVGVGFTNCTIYGGSGYGVYFYSAAAGATCINCYVEGITTPYTLEGASGTAFLINCAAYNSTGYSTNFSDANVQNYISCTASALTNGAGGDLTLNNNAGGGALLRAAGFPGMFPAGVSRGYQDIGCFQHADPVGGGLMFRRTFDGGVA